MSIPWDDLIGAEAVTFKAGVQKILRLEPWSPTEPVHYEAFHKMRDPDEPQQVKAVRALYLSVIEEDGKKVDKTWYAVHARLFPYIKAMLESGNLFTKPIGWTKTADGLDADWIVEVEGV